MYMYKLLIPFIILFVSVSAYSQNSTIDNLYEFFKGKKGVTTVNVTKELINMAMDAGQINLEDADLDIQKLLEKVKSIKVITCNKVEAGEAVVKSFSEEVANKIHFDKYKELLTVNDGDNGIRIVQKEANGGDGEFLVYVVENKSMTLVNIVGSIDMKSIGQISKLLNINKQPSHKKKEAKKAPK